MDRLARYMLYFSAVLGHAPDLRYQGVGRGSLKITCDVGSDSAPSVEEHLNRQRHGGGNKGAKKARTTINKMLLQDETGGYIYKERNVQCKVLDFPGVRLRHQEFLGAVVQEGFLDGILKKVTISRQCRNTVLINAEKNYKVIVPDFKTARELAQCLEQHIRIYGKEKRECDVNGEWILKSFHMDDYKILRTNKLSDVMHQMRAIEGSEWKEMEDPFAAWRSLRDGSP